jgi:hypothetical protein
VQVHDGGHPINAEPHLSPPGGAAGFARDAAEAVAVASRLVRGGGA